MNDKFKIRLLSIILGVCIIAIAGLSYYLWNAKHDSVRPSITAVPSSAHVLPDPWPKNWDPWKDPWDSSSHFSDLQKQMDEMMTHMWPGGSIFSQRGFGVSMSSPKVMVNETDDAYEVQVSVPEGQEIELNTELSDGILKISGKIKKITENDRDDGSYDHSMSTSQFSQSLALSEPIDESGMTIENKDGGMFIRVPKVH